MRARIAALLATFGLALALLVGAPAMAEQSVAQAAGETVRVTLNSQYGTQVKLISSNGSISYIGVLPGGRITSTARLDSWYLPSGRCAYFSMSGNTYLRTGSSLNPWVWIAPGATVSANIYRC